MKKINEYIVMTYRELKDKGWPTENFINNIKDVNIDEVDVSEYIYLMDGSDLKSALKFLKNNIIYTKSTKFFTLYKDLVRFATCKDYPLNKYIMNDLVNENPFVFNPCGICNVVEATNYYFATILFKKEKNPVLIYDDFNSLTLAMAIVINKIGIDKFANMYFNGDYTCLTSEVVNAVGPVMTKKIYDYAAKIFDENGTNLDLLNEILDTSDDLTYLSEYKDMLGRGIDYRMNHYNDEMIADFVKKPISVPTYVKTEKPKMKARKLLDIFKFNKKKEK
ncbi:MAG: hypothetical protein IJS56_01965 [Bacilli bacterium]|nr:hypothetical protein [Bacilli bacterium]